MIHPVDLAVPNLPASLEPLRIAHLTDLHVRGSARRFRGIAEQLSRARLDLALYTGDYMDRPRDEQAAYEAMGMLTEAVRPRLGQFGVFGNHDSASLCRRLRDLPVCWLDDRAVRVEGKPLVIGGVNGHRADSLSLAEGLYEASRRVEAGGREEQGDGRDLRIVLSHWPTLLPTASDLGVHLVFSGHTHGGQLRLPLGRSIYNSTDLPQRLSAGVLRRGHCLGVVSRGMGETFLPLRLLCSRQLPLLTLRRGPSPGEATDLVDNVMPW